MLLTISAPTVSIAIRAYRRRWLAEAIASVLGQTWRDLELVLYDDAGDLADMVMEFDDPRVRYHRAERSLEASGRFQAAVALCRGRYIGVLDDDDRYEPEFVARLAAALDADDEAGIAFCRAVWDVDGELHAALDGLRPGRQPDAAHALIAGRWQVQPSRMLIRREALADADRLQPMPDGVAPDFFLNVRAAVAGWHHVLVDEVLAVCRWHPQQLTRGGTGAYDRPIANVEQLRVDDPRLERARRERLARDLVERALAALRAGDRHPARSDLTAARRADASASRRWRRVARAVAAVPGAGVAVRRAHALKRRVHRRDALPPDVAASGGRQVARDAATFALGGAAAQAVTVLAAPVLTRLYDPADVGAAAVLMAAMSLVAVVACLRFDAAIPLARGPRSTAEVCALCVIAGALVTAVLAAVAAVFGRALCGAAGVPQVAPYVWLVPLHAGVAALGLVGVGLLIRRRRYGSLAGVRLSQAVGQSGTQIAAGAATGGAAWFAGGMTAGAAAYSLTSAAAARRGDSRPLRPALATAFRGTGAAARSWGRFAAWSSGSAILLGASLVVPAVMITALYGPAAGGLYVLAQRVIGLPVAFAADAVGSAWLGTAAEIVREERGTLAEPLKAVTRTLLAAGGAVMLVVLVSAPPLFAPVFGDEWGGGGELTLALAPLYFSIFAAAPAGQALQALGRTDLLTAVAAARLAAPVAGIAGGHALGWSLTASLGLYAAGMVAVSVGNVVLAWRLSR